MAERLLILALVAAVVLLAVAALRLGAVWRRRVAGGIAPRPELVAHGRPLLLAFSTPNCADCRYRQAPAVEQVRAALGAAIETRHVDASRDPDVAAHFGILTAPSTVILDSHGRVVARNDGFAAAERLLEQLGSLNE